MQHLFTRSLGADNNVWRTEKRKDKTPPPLPKPRKGEDKDPFEHLTLRIFYDIGGEREQMTVETPNPRYTRIELPGANVDAVWRKTPTHTAQPLEEVMKELNAVWNHEAFQYLLTIGETTLRDQFGAPVLHDGHPITYREPTAVRGIEIVRTLQALREPRADGKRKAHYELRDLSYPGNTDLYQALATMQRVDQTAVPEYLKPVQRLAENNFTTTGYDTRFEGDSLNEVLTGLACTVRHRSAIVDFYAHRVAGHHK